MTRPLRKAHLRIWLLLTVVLAGILVGAAINQRPTTMPENQGFVP